MAVVCQLINRFETKLAQRYESLITVCYMQVTVSVVDVDSLSALKLQTETVFPIANSSPAEIQDDLAIASIENVFVYSDRYGHSDLKSG